jgi:prepilin-type N-terminal cleavage/methylation domain-containing protein
MELNLPGARRHQVPMSRTPRRRRGQHGFTVTELLVSIAILGAIGASMAGAFAIGFRTLGPGGAQAKLTGSNDLIAFEQQIGADVARAVCLAAPTQTSIPTTGCTASIGKSPSTCGTVSSYLLCLAWYVPGTTTCHTVTYAQQAGTGVVLRRDLNDTTNASSTTRVGTGSLNLAASWTPSPTTNNAYKWTSRVAIVTAQVNNRIRLPQKPASTTFYLVPLAADPVSPAVAGGTIPC